MYKRLIYDAALEWVPYAAFAVTVVIFIAFVVRALSLRKENAERLARAPLDD